MEALLSQLGLVATAVLGYAGNVCATIVEQPLLLIVSGIMLLGAGVGIFGRLLSRG